jgi:hypothetical protein
MRPEEFGFRRNEPFQVAAGVMERGDVFRQGTDFPAGRDQAGGEVVDIERPAFMFT